MSGVGRRLWKKLSMGGILDELLVWQDTLWASSISLRFGVRCISCVNILPRLSANRFFARGTTSGAGATVNSLLFAVHGAWCICSWNSWLSIFLLNNDDESRYTAVSDIVRGDYSCVNKTVLGWQLAHYAKFIFLNRPRRMFRRYFVDDMKSFWYFRWRLLGAYKNSFGWNLKELVNYSLCCLWGN